MKKQILFPVLILSLLISCGIEQDHADKLEGKWLIIDIEGEADSALVEADSVEQWLEFSPCEDAYTNTCKMRYTFGDTSGTGKTAMLDYTIKGDECAIISLVPSNFPNFRMINKCRYIIRNLDENVLSLERYTDSLIINAVKLN